ncbi:class II aldolase/adducin family protein [Allorhodopirellula solitaria]|uniref:L-fuculose phosphate aldolase n=1 Tax=Allorhodopirellula solitaria TaxID=2527987 RepID=A0A5C5XBC5_9BACT|nr:class II aldolase/adducin family protein [Allorhodopirellula solitaria]TWT59202.1 L-fuculose phosphate aldolase [Allorhodopirellula solitaria]
MQISSSDQRAKWIHPRDEIIATMQRIYRSRMTTTSGGNLSIRDTNGDIWITPARVDKGRLQRDDIVCVRPDGSVDGKHPPSSEFPFHKAIYAVRPDIGAIVHAHPVALVAFSICGRTPETRIFHQANAVCGTTGFAPYALPGSERLGESIAKQFAGGCDSVILENHGVVVGGESLSQSFDRFEAFEFCAKTLIHAGKIGKIQHLDETQLQLARDRSVDLDSIDAHEPTSNELELRRSLSEFVRRGCRQGLLISTEGSFSARVDDDAFVITPTQRDRETLQPGDLVYVEGAAREAGKKASRAVLAHQAIYRKHPEVQAIAFAHPVAATAFSVTDAEFDSKTIPESYVFLRDVCRVPYGVQYRGDGSIADHISSSSPTAVLENDGVLITGGSILATFDRLEVFESTAEALVQSRAIGPLSVMQDNVISELRDAFGLND